jgi:hypothetical protein
MTPWLEGEEEESMRRILMISVEYSGGECQTDDT